MIYEWITKIDIACEIIRVMVYRTRAYVGNVTTYRAPRVISQSSYEGIGLSLCDTGTRRVSRVSSRNDSWNEL